MKKLAEGLWILEGFPNHVVNCYLAGDVLIDAGTKTDRKRILKQLQGQQLSAHVLTHGHSDHQGSSKAVCEQFEVPLWCGERDADAVTVGDVSSAIPDTLFTRALIKPLGELLAAGPAYPVMRRLKEGDQVGDFTVLETPGHTPGHISFWREKDRVLIVGDTLFNMNLLTLKPGLREPFGFATTDIEQNRRSAQKLAELEPSLACFGHGPPLRDPQRLKEFVATISR